MSLESCLKKSLLTRAAPAKEFFDWLLIYATQPCSTILIVENMRGKILNQAKALVLKSII